MAAELTKVIAGQTIDSLAERVVSQLSSNYLQYTTLSEIDSLSLDDKKKLVAILSKYDSVLEYNKCFNSTRGPAAERQPF